ncbi:Tetraspanin-7 [Sarcoptes scabiei]|nr:Tetraspanin-7 [Sarcoptes scabiei]
MYKQIEPTIMQLTAAAGFDNLSIATDPKDNHSSTVLVCHDNKTISINRIDRDGKEMETSLLKSIKHNSIIMIKLLTLMDKLYVMVHSPKMISVYSIDNGGKLLFDFNFNALHKTSILANSIEKVCDDLFCLATEHKLLMFSVTTQNDSIQPKDFHQDLKSSSSSLITKFFGCDHQSSSFALIEKQGKVIVWKWNEKGNNFIRSSSFDIHPNTKLSAIQTYKNWMIIGTVSGQIQIINIKTGRLNCEIQAHIKCITTMNVALANGFLISGSEDSFARLFKINSTEENDCQVLFKPFQYIVYIIYTNNLLLNL